MLRRVVHDGASPAPLGPFGLTRHNARMTRLAAAVLVSSAGDPFSQTVSLVLLYQATRTPLAIAAAYAVEMLGVLTVGGLIGAAADRLDRRRLIVRLEAIRFLIVATLPLVIGVSVYLLYPCLLLLASIEALVQPSRQAAIPELVGRGEVGAANALLMTTMTVAQAVGFAVAGAAIAHASDPRLLYLVDALSFAAAAIIVASLGSMGGGIVTARLQGGVGRAWMVPGATPLLVIAAATVLFVGMLNPSLLPLAYVLSSNGATTFTLLEVCLIAGGLIGSVIAGRFERNRRLPTQAASLWVFAIGVWSVAVGHNVLVAGLAIAISGVGNAIYSVTNTSALMETADSANRGTVMSARFTVTRASTAVGLVTGAAVTGWLGSLRAFGTFGMGLFLVAALYSAYLVMQGRMRPHSSRYREDGDTRWAE